MTTRPHLGVARSNKRARHGQMIILRWCLVDGRRQEALPSDEMMSVILVPVPVCKLIVRIRGR